LAPITEPGVRHEGPFTADWRQEAKFAVPALGRLDPVPGTQAGCSPVGGSKRRFEACVWRGRTDSWCRCGTAPPGRRQRWGRSPWAWPST